MIQKINALVSFEKSRSKIVNCSFPKFDFNTVQCDFMKG